MNRIRTTSRIAAVICLCAAATQAEWKMKQGPLMTRWAAEIDPQHVLPEYPRPQLVREDWQNLNGVWEFQAGEEGDETPAGKKLSGEILVPFCPESAISGVMEHHDRMWYRRMITIPPLWTARRLLLHFGAVDYESEVFIDGKSIGVHKGGYDSFSYDITNSVKPGGVYELIVRVLDPTNNGGQPRGKQSLRPGGIMYTPTSGIWQTVWMEPVASGGVESIKVTPDIDHDAVQVAVTPMGIPGATSKMTVTVKDGTEVLATREGQPGDSLRLRLPDVKRWSPDSPFLYDLQISVTEDGHYIDSVNSYFGMRKIELGDDAGVKKLLLNGKFIFQLGPLDQGFWPDGIYTAPTEAALKYDVEATKAMGFNFIRKHIKVEPARWYYWCDKMGLMVWQDMPSPNSYDDHPVPPVDVPEFKSELQRMVTNLQNVPSIIAWEIFNESQGQHDTPELVAMVKEMDPTRIVNQASGGDHKGVGDVFDIHPYPAPQAPPPHANMALVDGEFGGIGMKVPGHLWKADQGGSYVMVDTPTEMIEMYSEFTQLLKKFRDENGLSGAVYTQTTDVETEVNGLMTYDRQPKVDFKLLAAANRFELMPPAYRTILATSESEQQTWQYTFNKPGDDWVKPTFEASGWKTGKGPFGIEGTPNIAKLGTKWDGEYIWMRRTFNPGKLSADDLSKLYLRFYHDDDAVVYINGVLALKADGCNGNYFKLPISAEAKAAIKPDAENVIAVHCHQTGGGQYVDVGLVAREAKP